MAIPKLYKILEEKEKEIFTKKTLQNCKLVIDGGCLVYSLLFEAHKSDNSTPVTAENRATQQCDSRLFGGDYAHFATIIDAFFERLQSCQITPIIVFDGTFPSEKLRNKQTNSIYRLGKVISDLQTDTVGPNAHSLWYWHVANQVIKKRELFSFTCFYEADEMIVKLAATLRCPILTSDSDFYIYSTLRGGIIPIRRVASLIDINSSQKYLDWEVYLIDRFLAHTEFSGISPEMLTLAAPLLGQDAFCYRDADKIVKLIPNKPEFSKNWEVDKVYFILQWLQRHTINRHSFKEVKVEIMGYCDRAIEQFNNLEIPDHARIADMKKYKDQIGSFTAAQYTQSPTLNVPKKFDLSTVKTFYKNNPTHFQSIKLFDDKSKQSTFERQVLRGQIQSRLLSIVRHRFEFCPMLLEDYSRFDSSHYCYFAWNTESESSFASAVYGLLRKEHKNPTVVIAWRRPHNAKRQFTEKQKNRKYQIDEQSFQKEVLPSVKVGMLKSINPKAKVRNEVCQMILQTVGIDQLKLKKSLAKIGNLKKLSAHQQMQLRTMMMALIYFANRSPTQPCFYETGIAFIHALLANILLVGQIGPNYFAIAPIIHLDNPENLEIYETVCTRATFKIFITHLYQTYQNCLSDLTLLAEILNLRENGMNADEYVCALQGTFIHNLTIDLAASENVDSRLEEILGSEISRTIRMLFQIVSQSALQ